MPITEHAAHFLLSPEGRALTRHAESLRDDGTDPLAALTRLRKTAAAPDLCAAAWELAVLRPRAAAKFGPEAANLFFTRESLEQASGRHAAAYHAARFAELGAGHVSDTCGGIGADALAFARAGLPVTLYETDPVRAAFARANAAELGLSSLIQVRCEDVTQATLAPGAVWFDPARRENGRRLLHPDDALPPLSVAHGWAAQGLLPLGIKLSPAIDHVLADTFHARLEFISDGGECKEALLWRAVPPAEAHTVRAVLLSGNAPQTLAGDPDLPAPLETVPQAQYLYEPDPAVIRAHLVGTLALRLGARAFDPQIAYLTSDTLTPSPFARTYAVWERFPYSRRALQEAMIRLRIGRVVIKKRGFPLEPEAVRRQLKLSGDREVTVVLTRQGDSHLVLLCSPV